MFDDNELPASTLEVVEPYLKKPHFTGDYLERKTNNSAVGSLVQWVRGVVRYILCLRLFLSSKYVWYLYYSCRIV